MTWEFWAYSTGNINDEYVFAKSGDGSLATSGYFIHTSDFFDGGSGNIGIFIVGSSAFHRIHIRTTGTAFHSQVGWHHIAITYDGSLNANGIKIYLDGNQENTTISENALDNSANNGTFQIRATAPSGEQRFVDEARVWNVVRSPSDIANNMNTILVGNEAGLIGYYRFENNFNDSSLNGFDGIVSGEIAPTFLPLFLSSQPPRSSNSRSKARSW